MKFTISSSSLARQSPKRRSPRPSPFVTRPPRRHLLVLKRRQKIGLQSEIVSSGIGATGRNLRGHQLQDRRFVRVSQNKHAAKKGCSKRRAFSAKSSGRYQI